VDAVVVPLHARLVGDLAPLGLGGRVDDRRQLDVCVAVFVQVRRGGADVLERRLGRDAQVRLAVVAEDDDRLPGLVDEEEPVVGVENLQREARDLGLDGCDRGAVAERGAALAVGGCARRGGEGGEDEGEGNVASDDGTSRGGGVRCPSIFNPGDPGRGLSQAGGSAAGPPWG
jgi:hypothetical protein